jgi:hypothetical protein
METPSLGSEKTINIQNLKIIGLAEAELNDRLDKKEVAVAPFVLSKMLDFAQRSSITVKIDVSTLKIRLGPEGN